METGSSFLQAAITVKPYSETYEKNSGIVEGNKENHKLMAEASVRDPRIYGLGHLYGNVAIMAKGVVEVIGGVGTAAGATYGAAAPAVAVGAGGGLIVDGALSVGNGYENSKESIQLIQNAGGGGRGEGTVKTVSNMGEFFKSGFGKSIENNLSKTSVKVKGQIVYKVTNKNGDYLKKGYGIYLDSLHYDHLEVCDKLGKIKYVLNLDGTLNADKTAKAFGRIVEGW